MYDKGICYIKDICDEYGHFLSTYTGLIKAVKTGYPKLNNFSAFIQLPIHPSIVKTICKDERGSKRFYDIFNHSYTKPKCENKWKTKLNLPDFENWNLIHYLPHKVTNDSKLLWLQFRIIHRILGVKDLLYKQKISNDSTCGFCKLYTETIEHLFFYCKFSKIIWTKLENLINSNSTFQVIYFHVL